MTRRGAITSIILLLLPSFARAAGPLPELQIYTDVIAWLRQALQSLAQLGAQLDRRRLITSLDDLGDSFEQTLRTKRKIKNALDTKPLDSRRIERLARDMRKNIDSSSDALVNVAFLLKQEGQGQTIADDLHRAMTKKEAWVRRLDSGDTLSENQIGELSEQIKASYDGLTTANGQLADLVRELKQRR